MCALSGGKPDQLGLLIGSEVDFHGREATGD